jgi:hypothetical protein
MPLATLLESGVPLSSRRVIFAHLRLLDNRRLLDALRRCRASVARSNALLFDYLLRHGAPSTNHRFAMVRSSRTSECRQAFAVAPARASRFAPSRHRCVVRMGPRAAHGGLVPGSPGGGGIKRVLGCCLDVDRSVLWLAANEFG